MLTPLETGLIALLLAILMFGMGATLTVDRFRDVVARPRAVLIGLASQFGWMPLLAYLLSIAFGLSNEAALGLVILGTCPGGTTSNMYAYFARADVALSVSMTAASKLVAVVAMPVCLFLYARRFSDASLSIPYGDVMKTLVFLLVPVAFGMAFRKRFGERFAIRAEKAGSFAGLGVLAFLVTITIVRNRAGFAAITLPTYAAAVLLGTGGLVLGDLAARAFGLPVAQRRAVSFETGVQNSPLAFAIIATSFDGETQRRMMELPLLYAFFIMIQASLVTLYYRRTTKAPSETQDEAVETFERAA